MSDTQLIGIVGGTFNPIHWGHLLMGEAARTQAKLGQVLFMPNHIPPHRESMDLAPADDRYQMTLLATLSHPAFSASRLELDRPPPSYTYDTVNALLEEPSHRRAIFVCGADALLHHQWHKFPELLEILESLLVAPRAGSPFETVARQYVDLPKPLRDKILPLDMPAVDISSSSIRERVRSGKSIRYLVPDPVETYIMKQRLYARP